MSLDGFSKRFSWIRRCSSGCLDRRAVHIERSSDDSPNADDAVVHGVPENFRRLRSRLHVLRDPGFRGRFRSRPISDLVTESQRLAEQGVRELVIVSQDTMAYGKDLGLANGITALLRELAESRRAEVGPVSVLLSEHGFRRTGPAGCARKNAFASISIFPYQHASRPILERMKRGGNREIYERQMESIRKLMPDAGLRTSFIVGFPGESRERFQRNAHVLEERRLRQCRGLPVFR